MLLSRVLRSVWESITFDRFFKVGLLLVLLLMTWTYWRGSTAGRYVALKQEGGYPLIVDTKQGYLYYFVDEDKTKDITSGWVVYDPKTGATRKNFIEWVGTYDEGRFPK